MGTTMLYEDGGHSTDYYDYSEAVTSSVGIGNPDTANMSLDSFNFSANTYDENSTVEYDNSSFYDDYYYDDEYYYYENALTVYNFEIFVLGYLRLALVILTTLANVFVVCYFLKSQNRGKATSLLFVSIAISDTITGLILLPNSIYIYGLDNSDLVDNSKDLTEEWCRAYMYMRLYFSRVLHTISIWQTVLLGIQRYMCVCHPFFSGRICTFGKTFMAIIVIYVLAFVLHIYQLIDNKVQHNACAWKLEDPCTISCVYVWFCIALMHFIPCTMLAYLTSKTLKGLNKARKRISGMGPGVPSQRSTRDRIITITATLVVIVFLIPELPYCVYRLAFVIKKHILDPFTTLENHVFLSAYEITLIVSFHCNFWIYCVMMRDFRLALVRLTTCGLIKRGMKRLRTFSRSSRSSGTGSVMTSISRTSSIASRHRILSNMTSVHSVHSDVQHTVVPLSPTSGYAGPPTYEQTEDVGDDDVFT